MEQTWIKLGSNCENCVSLHKVYTKFTKNVPVFAPPMSPSPGWRLEACGGDGGGGGGGGGSSCFSVGCANLLNGASREGQIQMNLASSLCGCVVTDCCMCISSEYSQIQALRLYVCMLKYSHIHTHMDLFI